MESEIYIYTKNIKAWGFINKNIVIEQISYNQYVYCDSKGNKGIKEVEATENDKGQVTERYFIIKDTKYIITDNKNISLFCNTPSMDKALSWKAGTNKKRTYKEIINDVKKVIKELMDLQDPTDIEVIALFIGQSWLKAKIDNSFFIGLDATKGGGKTTLLEIISFFTRHGFLAGDVSPPALVRLVDALDLNVFVDELDQNKSEQDVQSMLRKGQRRNNPYIRCEGRNFTPKTYDVFGMHGFSYRSELEDAFMDRTLSIHLGKSTDHRLAIINTHKEKILKPLADELFFWYMDNILTIKEKITTTAGATREEYYKEILEEFTKKEKAVLKKLFGRDSELAYLSLRTSKLLGLNFVKEVKAVMKKKKLDASTNENFYYEELRNFIASNIEKYSKKKLIEGQNADWGYYPKNKVFAEYSIHLKELGINATIGTKKFNSYLRDIGFIQGLNLTNQRVNGKSVQCLIFTEEIIMGLTPNPLESFGLKGGEKA